MQAPLMAGILSIPALWAENGVPHPSSYSFHSKPLNSAQETVQHGRHLVILRDGTKIFGEIDCLPAIDGEPLVDLKEIATIEMLSTTQMQLKTDEGALVICTIPEERIRVAQYFPNAKNPTHAVTQEIEPKTIRAIVFKELNRPKIKKDEDRPHLDEKKAEMETLQLALAIKDKEIEENRLSNERLCSSYNLEIAALQQENARLLERQEELEEIIERMVMGLEEQRTKLTLLEAVQENSIPNNTHLVSDEENLNTISLKFYGTPTRWVDIYEANEDRITDVNHLSPGTVLTIPD